MKATCVIGHPQCFFCGVNFPVAILVLGIKTQLAVCRLIIFRSELTHAGRAANVASNDTGRSFIDEQATLNRIHLPAKSTVKNPDDTTEHVFELDRIGCATETLQTLSRRTDIAEINDDVHFIRKMRLSSDFN